MAVFRKKHKQTKSGESLQLLQRFALYFFDRPRLTAILTLLVFGFGVLSYTTLLTREGFPSINVPFAVGQGAYLVNDPAKVDQQVAKPLSDFLLKQSSVKTVQTNSLANFYTVVVQYADGVDSGKESQVLQDKITAANILPPQASIKFTPAKFGFTMRGDDSVISFFSSAKPQSSTASLVDPADDAVAFLRLLPRRNLV